MLSSRFIFILIFTFWTTTVWAEPYRRLVNFEWEAIENAQSYEVEIKQVKEDDQGKIFTFKVKEAAWNGRLSPGKYTMKLRSRDYRGVPGDWSEPSAFDVGLDNVLLKSPAPRTQLSTTEKDEASVKFQWEPVGGANAYQFELTSGDAKTKIQQKVSDPHLELKIPVAMNYSWKVFALNDDGFQSEVTSEAQFTVLGAPLAAPVIEKPESEYVREIKWNHPSPSAVFRVAISRYNDVKKKWEPVKSVDNTSELSIAFDDNLPGGRYAISVRSKGELRPSSPLARQFFKVKNGDRSPAAEYTTLVRKSIERVEGWYGIASYLITEMQFRGVNPERQTAVAYNALGGTGRIGLGWFKPEKSWGFLSIIDMSGFTFSGTTHTFASAELNAVYRKTLNERGEVRLQMGPYYKELPETTGDIPSGNSVNLKISAAGPHFGAEYWYSLTPKLGLQANAHMYLSMLKVSTPNGQDLSPTLSTQFGFLGSYRFTKSFTGLVGYARREEKTSYKAAPSADNYAIEGDVNESTIVGNYLNFFAEWAF